MTSTPTPSDPVAAVREAHKLTQRDLETLNDLCSWQSDWSRPMDVGGSNGSHHSATLAKLTKLGYADSRQRSSWMSRGSKVYRATEAGFAVIAALADQQEGSHGNV